MKTSVGTRRDRRNLAILITMAFAFCIIAALAGCATKQPANAGIADTEITNGVEADLAAESQLSPYTIAVATNRGIVHLSGLVATSNDRDVAEGIATTSRGVVRVENYIRFGGSQDFDE